MGRPSILFIHAGINISDEQILKDTCLIPCLLQKIYGYNSTIAAYSINVELLKKYFPQCNFICIKRSGNFEKDALDFLEQNSLSYDMFYVFGGDPCNYNFAAKYKSKNPNGKVYCKLDMNRFWLSGITSQAYFEKLLQLCDLTTVECKNMHELINRKVPYDIGYLPNGYYDTFETKPLSYSDKQNIILTAGRLGHEQKRTEDLIESFLAANLSGWKLRLAGNIEPPFLPKLEKYKSEPGFSNIEFIGHIDDRQQMENEYRHAKVFCMTSRYECFAHVFTEAAKNGCYIISTDVDGAYDVTDGKKYGTIVPIGDKNSISIALKSVCADEKLIKSVFSKVPDFVMKKYSWEYLIAKLNLMFKVRGIVQ